MKNINQIEKKAPAFKFVMILVAATSVILVLIISPWNVFPTLVTEDVTVIAVTNYGCVAESVLGHSVVVPDCNAKPGDVISATFYIPAMEINGYYDRVQEKLTLVNP
ncbi:MAG: hypothetical protein HC944_02915 [Nanoarchaeota archaeon]|nr:hypothetical protein [Nanoarchaeota archaeon]